MTTAFIVNRRAAILRVLLVLAITFALGFMTGRVSAAPKSALAAMPAAPSGETSGNLPALSGALDLRPGTDGGKRLRWLASESQGGSVKAAILGGAPPSRTLPGPRIGRLVRPGDKSPTVTGGVLQGSATWGYFGGHVVTRYPRGTRIRVCGVLGCWSGRSWGYGPAVWTGHIADLDRAVFARICGSPSRGIASVTLEVRR